MNKVFDEKQFEKLDSPERKKLLPIDTTIKAFDLNKDDIVADFGCGVGYFTLPISKVVNTTVLAIDISDVMLEELEKRTKIEKISNVKLINSKRNSDEVEDNSLDFLLMSLVLHEINDTKAFLINLKRKVKDKGRICIIEWKKEKRDMGPPSEHRIGLKELIKICHSVNLKVSKEIDISDEFYGLVIEKTTGL